MAPHCEIQFDNNPLGIYHAGQELSGRVHLRLDEPMTVNGFSLLIIGYVEISWYEKDDDTMPDHYSGSEKLLHSKTALIARSKEGVIEIPVGVHEYKFSCVLPPHLPTSFEGKYGKIRYIVCASLDRPWKFNQTCKVAFTVLKRLDLNLDPLVRQPKKIELSQTFCCWPCTSRPLLITIETPATGYVPGQKIPLIITLNNSSNVGVHGVKCTLARTEYYTSQTPHVKTRSVDRTLVSLTTAVTNDKYARLTQELEIPSIAPTGKSSILAIEYNLNINVQMDSCRMNPEIEIPITIGTVPLQATSLTPVSTGATANYGSFDERLLPTAPPLLANFDDPLPPTYEEATHGTVVNVNDEPNAIGFQPYVPRYPVYKFDSSAKC